MRRKGKMGRESVFVNKGDILKKDFWKLDVLKQDGLLEMKTGTVAVDSDCSLNLNCSLAYSFTNFLIAIFPFSFSIFKK